MKLKILLKKILIFNADYIIRELFLENTCEKKYHHLEISFFVNKLLRGYV